MAIPPERKTPDVLESVFIYAAVWAFGGAMGADKQVCRDGVIWRDVCMCVLMCCMHAHVHVYIHPTCRIVTYSTTNPPTINRTS